MDRSELTSLYICTAWTANANKGVFQSSLKSYQMQVYLSLFANRPTVEAFNSIRPTCSSQAMVLFFCHIAKWPIGESLLKYA
jgi:hypothetical protein